VNLQHLTRGTRVAVLLLDGSFRAGGVARIGRLVARAVRIAAPERLADRRPPRRWPRFRQELAADPQTIWRERVLAAVAYLTWAPRGVSEGEVMPLCRWETRSMFDRYNIIGEADLAAAVAKRSTDRRTLRQTGSASVRSTVTL